MVGGLIAIGLIDGISGIGVGNIGVIVGVIVFIMGGGTSGGIIGGTIAAIGGTTEDASEAPTTFDVTRNPGGGTLGVQIN